MVSFTPYDLRRRLTVQEHILWNYLRARRMLGFKFRRQHPMGPFVLDFVCLSEKVIIELDGPIHIGREIYDAKRDGWLRSKGFVIIRIKNEEIDGNLEGTLKKLRDFFADRISL